MNQVEENLDEKREREVLPSARSGEEHPPDDGAAWAPLRQPLFRSFWIASLISNLGTWIHEVGAGWLMTSLDPDPQMVSAVRIAISGPMVFLAIPAGVLADRMDRRQLLIVTQLMLFSLASLLSLLTWQEVIHPGPAWLTLQSVWDWSCIFCGNNRTGFSRPRLHVQLPETSASTWPGMGRLLEESSLQPASGLPSVNTHSPVC